MSELCNCERFAKKNKKGIFWGRQSKLYENSNSDFCMFASFAISGEIGCILNGEGEFLRFIVGTGEVSDWIKFLIYFKID